MSLVGISIEYRIDLHIFIRKFMTAVRYRIYVLDPSVRLYAASVSPAVVLSKNVETVHME